MAFRETIESLTAETAQKLRKAVNAGCVGSEVESLSTKMDNAQLDVQAFPTWQTHHRI